MVIGLFPELLNEFLCYVSPIHFVLIPSPRLNRVMEEGFRIWQAFSSLIIKSNTVVKDVYVLFHMYEEMILVMNLKSIQLREKK